MKETELIIILDILRILKILKIEYHHRLQKELRKDQWQSIIGFNNYISEYKNNSPQDTNNIMQILPKFHKAVIILKELPIYYDSTTNKIKAIFN